MRQLRHALDSEPWETIGALVKERITKRELALQLQETHMIANPDAGLANWVLAAWNAQRRDIETLAVLLGREEGAEAGKVCAACGDRFAGLGAYLAHKGRCQASAATPSPAPVSQPSAAAPPAPARDSGTDEESQR